MDNYIVSARKYRPATFHSVIGQKSLTTTLKNAISNHKLAHAYLFCGPRGVGKTTCARIFAKTINCYQPTADGEACSVCESCVSFDQQRSFNIHELDAASNNSVEDVRSLIEQVRILPQIGKYKVYIIDEVHMLSASAFNAFLKTLEEPPHHAIFILATTEKHKILPTILSRCQIYDFNRIGVNDMVDYLEYVAGQEGIQYEKEALNAISQKADGGMRDALSIFDQVVSFTGGNITYKAVIENLNVLDYDYYFRLTGFLLQNNVSESLLLLNEILSKGFDGQHILSGLSSFFRDLLVCKDPQTIVLFEVGDAVKTRYTECAVQCQTPFLYRAIEMANESDLSYRASKNKRLLIEILLIRLCQLNSPQAQEDDKKKTIIEPFIPDKAVIQQASTPQPSETVRETTTETAQSSAPRTSGPSTSAPSESPKLASPLVGFSLKKPGNQLQNEKQGDPESKSEPSSLNASFTQEELNAAWKAYTHTIPDKVHLRNTMLNIMPTLLEDSLIQVLVFNPGQETKLQEEAISLLEFLRDKLQNASIRMEVKITEDNPKQLAYTDAEKYKMMVSKNPELDNLVQEFQLRLD